MSVEDLKNDEVNKLNEFKGAMSLIEKVDMNALRIIRDNFEEVFNRLGKKIKIQKKTTVYKQVNDYKQAYTVINNFYKAKQKTDIVNYKYTSKLTYGRRFHLTPSLQECPRPIRHAISKSIYHDIDIKNAHPLFLLKKCESLGFHHPILKEYVEGDREGFLKTLFGITIKKMETDDEDNVIFVKHTIQSRDDAKAYFLQVLNGGGNGKTGHSKIDNFFNRHKEFLDLFFNRPENDKYRTRANREASKKNWDNRKGSALNYYLCEQENIVLTHIEEVLQKEGVKYGTLCFDGLMVYREDVKDIKLLISKIEEYLFEKMQYKISISEKEMDEAVDLSGLFIKADIDMTEEGLAKYILETLKEDIKYSKKKKVLYKYNENTALWEEYDMDCFKTIISSILIPHIKKDPDEEKIDKNIEIIKGNSKQNNIIQQMTPYIKMMNDDILIDDFFDAGNGLFPIADNMVMDFKTLTVRARVKTDYFTRTTNRKYLKDYNVEFVKKYYHDVLVKIKNDDDDEKVDESSFCLDCIDAKNKICPSKEYVDCLCSTFACIMTGEMNRSMKKFINLIGESGNNGKSLFLELHQKMLESFAGSVQNRVIVEQKNKSGHDAELFGLVDKWMMCLSETSKNASYDEVRLKQITGYDAVPLRDAGGNSKSMIEVKFRAVPVAATNQMCQFKTTAFMNRLMCFPFVNVFTQDSSFADKIIEMTDHFFSHLCLYANQYYNNNKTFNICNEVISKTNEIKKENEPILLWVENQEMFEYKNGVVLRIDEKEIPEKDRPNYRIPKDIIYNSYRVYCESNNKQPEGSTTFHKDFQNKFKLKTSKQNVYINNNKDIKQKDCYFGIIRNKDFDFFSY
jgi:phage/plasmid-associated DNA primase